MLWEVGNIIYLYLILLESFREVVFVVDGNVIYG